MPRAYSQEETDIAGLVLGDMVGEWLLDSGKVVDVPIAAGQTLPYGGVVRLSRGYQQQYPNRGRISILLANERFEVRSCEIPGACIQPIQLPATDERKISAVTRLINAVKSLFAHETERFSIAISRGKGVALHEAVLALDDGKTNFAPMLTNHNSGRYLLTLTAVTPRGTPRSIEEIEIPLVLNGAKTAVVAPGPGLYSVTAVDVMNHEPVETDAWVLLVKQTDYERTAEAFQSALKTTERLGAQDPPPSLRSVLRAYLEHLSKSIDKSE